MREIELENGRVIVDVTRIADGEGGLVNVHTPGKGHFVVDPGEIVRNEEAGD